MHSKYKRKWWTWVNESLLTRDKSSYSPKNVIDSIDDKSIKYLESSDFLNLDTKSRIHILSAYIISRVLEPNLEKIKNEPQFRWKILECTTPERHAYILKIVEYFLLPDWEDNTGIWFIREDYPQIYTDVCKKLSEDLLEDGKNPNSPFYKLPSREKGDFTIAILDGLNFGMLNIIASKNTFKDMDLPTKDVQLHTRNIVYQLASINMSVVGKIVTTIFEWNMKTLEVNIRDSAFEIINNNWKLEFSPQKPSLTMRSCVLRVLEKLKGSKTEGKTLFCPALFSKIFKQLSEILLWE